MFCLQLRRRSMHRQMIPQLPLLDGDCLGHVRCGISVKQSRLFDQLAGLIRWNYNSTTTEIKQTFETMHDLSEDDCTGLWFLLRKPLQPPCVLSPCLITFCSQNEGDVYQTDYQGELRGHLLG